MNQQTAEPGLFIGIDWADQKHDCHVIDRNGKGFHQEIKHSAENINTWVPVLFTALLSCSGGSESIGCWGRC
jgi:hypothetical protein